MKLSEAMLLGSVGSKQGFGPQLVSKNGGLCAIAAALQGVGLDVHSDEDVLNVKFMELFPIESVLVLCPVCKSDEYIIVGDVIWHLNDYHRWPRPQIAAWVAQLEQMYDRQEDGAQPGVEPGSISTGHDHQQSGDAPAPHEVKEVEHAY